MNNRKAGLLLHITSLPSDFGVGDLGPAARKFADFLHRTHQSYWQILPLNPVSGSQGYSPYSSFSSMAGNTLLISPELLARDGLLEKGALERYRLPVEIRADFETAEKNKGDLLETAWNTFRKGDFKELTREFESFSKKESEWLNDYALFTAISDNQNRKPWYDWPPALKNREDKALKEFRVNYSESIEKEKWFQFLFFRQWSALRKYCSKRNISFFGDIPFYVSHLSADVWANREIFELEASGKMKGIAGVPPDYFNENGQLWMMPVFRWDVLKRQNYAWWIQRLRVNMNLFDLVRIDHFRAFVDYWEVPADEETAKNGQWKLGPGEDFFKVVFRELGKINLVAEDLGDISDEVFTLRDKLGLPGMKVLQFAFGKKLPVSEHAPHNYERNFIAYSGTHDNNTVKGWYREEGKKYHEQIEAYLGFPVKPRHIPNAFCRLALGSVANTAILPVQDVLGLDETGRMNNPGDAGENWRWRLLPGEIKPQHRKKLKRWMEVYGRGERG